MQNLPLGIVSPAGGAPRAAHRHWRPGAGPEGRGAAAGLLPEASAAALGGETLNALFALPAAERRALRRRLSALLSDPAHRGAVEPLLHDAAACALHLPAAIGDYTDFYAGIHHATNVGLQFRPDAPLLPNYKHVPIGYHGRASSVRPSGVPVVRPKGQRKPPGQDAPDYGPTRRLDPRTGAGGVDRRR